jgi:hypothetical protein
LSEAVDDLIFGLSVTEGSSVIPYQEGDEDSDGDVGNVIVGKIPCSKKEASLCQSLQIQDESFKMSVSLKCMPFISTK